MSPAPLPVTLFAPWPLLKSAARLGVVGYVGVLVRDLVGVLGGRRTLHDGLWSLVEVVPDDLVAFVELFVGFVVDFFTDSSIAPDCSFYVYQPLQGALLGHRRRI